MSVYMYLAFSFASLGNLALRFLNGKCSKQQNWNWNTTERPQQRSRCRQRRCLRCCSWAYVCMFWLYVAYVCCACCSMLLLLLLLDATYICTTYTQRHCQNAATSSPIGLPLPHVSLVAAPQHTHTHTHIDSHRYTRTQTQRLRDEGTYLYKRA